jgi:hypothetical protein
MDNKELESVLRNHETRINKLEAALSAPEQRGAISIKKDLSLKEFILQKQPKSEPHTALAIAYYLEKYRQISQFTISDLEEGFKNAKEPIPSNLSDAVYKNAKRGLFMELKGKKEGKKIYTITNTGERLVENNFKES